MVDVTRRVRALAAVDGPFFVYAKEIFTATLLGFFVRHQPADIFNDSFAFRNRFRGE